MVENLEAYIWTSVSFIFLLLGFLATFPAWDEYKAAKEDLMSLGPSLNGSKVMAEMYKILCQIILAKHTIYCFLWIVFLSVGVISILIPPVDTEQAQTRSLFLVSGLIGGEVLIGTIQFGLFMMTVVMRRARHKWRQKQIFEYNL